LVSYLVKRIENLHCYCLCCGKKHSCIVPQDKFVICLKPFCINAFATNLLGEFGSPLVCPYLTRCYKHPETHYFDLFRNICSKDIVDNQIIEFTHSMIPEDDLFTLANSLSQTKLSIFELKNILLLTVDNYRKLMAVMDTPQIVYLLGVPLTSGSVMVFREINPNSTMRIRDIRVCIDCGPATSKTFYYAQYDSLIPLFRLTLS